MILNLLKFFLILVVTLITQPEDFKHDKYIPFDELDVDTGSPEND